MKAGLFTILAALLFASRTAIMKLIASNVAPTQALFVQNAAAFLLCLFIGGWSALTRAQPMILTHAARAFGESSMLFIAYLLLVHLPTEHVTLMSLWGPLFMPLLLWMWQRSPIPLTQRWGLAVGWLGLLFICFLVQEETPSTRLMGVAMGLFGSLALLATGTLRSKQPPSQILAWGHALATFVFFFLALPTWMWPSLVQWALLILIGILSVLVALLLLRFSKPNQPFSGWMYTAILFSMAIDWEEWAFLPGTWFLIGGVLAVLGCSLIVSVRR